MIIAPTEPQRLRELGTVSLRPEKYGCDFLILGHGKTRIGVQRKKFPEDFLTSIADGRLYLQMNMMQVLSHSFVIIEGYGKWSNDGVLVEGGEFKGLTYSQLLALLFSMMFEKGVPTLWVRDMNQTIDVLVTLEDWAGKVKHSSLKTRPGVEKDAWGRKGNSAFQRHILQGFPGIGPETAERIVDHFGVVPLTWSASKEELMEVPGVGKVTAEKLIRALDVM